MPCDGIANHKFSIVNSLAERVGFSAEGGCAYGAEPSVTFVVRFPTAGAERVGFEPTVPLRVHHLSRVANSTTLAPLQMLFHFFQIRELLV